MKKPTVYRIGRALCTLIRTRYKFCSPDAKRTLESLGASYVIWSIYFALFEWSLYYYEWKGLALNDRSRVFFSMVVLGAFTWVWLDVCGYRVAAIPHLRKLFCKCILTTFLVIWVATAFYFGCFKG